MRHLKKVFCFFLIIFGHMKGMFIEGISYDQATETLSITDKYQVALVRNKKTGKAIRQFQYNEITPTKKCLCCIIRKQQGQWVPIELEERFKNDTPTGIKYNVN